MKPGGQLSQGARQLVSLRLYSPCEVLRQSLLSHISPLVPVGEETCKQSQAIHNGRVHILTGTRQKRGKFQESLQHYLNQGPRAFCEGCSTLFFKVLNMLCLFCFFFPFWMPAKYSPEGNTWGWHTHHIALSSA